MRVRLWIQHKHEDSCASKEVGDFSLDAMEDEEVSLVYGVFEYAFGALGEMMLIFGLLDGLEVEALVDVIEVVEVDYG
ncbi:hypothetical protein Tco_0879051 [Tanacetum coccineum]